MFSALRSGTTRCLTCGAATITKPLLSSAVEFALTILVSLFDGIEIGGSIHQPSELRSVVTCIQPIDHIAVVWKTVKHQYFRTQRCHIWIV